MSDHISELPPEAQAHVDQLHPDLQQAMGNRILQLSHLDFYDLEDQGPDPDPSQFYSPTRVDNLERLQPQVDTVTTYMNAASEALHTAHDSLLEQGKSEADISPGELVTAACDALVEEAAHEKDTGQTERVVSNLETVLVIQSLMHHDRQNDKGETLAHQVVRQDLATEFVQAANNTFGLISVTKLDERKYKLVPASTLAQEHSLLLHVASDLDFNDNFSKVEDYPDKAHAEDRAELSPQDLLTLANIAEDQANTGKARELLEEAFLAAERKPIMHADTVAALVVEADELGVPALSEGLDKLRGQRQPGLGYTTGSSKAVDEAIPRLLQAGHEDLAQELVSSHPNELARSQKAIQAVAGDSEAADQLLEKVKVLHERKQEALRVALHAHGATDATVLEILSIAVDPDAATTFDPALWQQYDTLEPNAKDELLKATGNAEPTAQAIMALEANGLAIDTPQLLDAMLQLDSPEARTRYAQSAAAAWKELQDISTDPDMKDLAESAKNELTGFEDPAQALQSARELFGPDVYLAKLSDLDSIFRRRDTPLAHIPEGLTAVVADMKDYLPPERYEQIAGVMTYQDNPTERAKLVLAGLKAASPALVQEFQVLADLATDPDPKARASKLMQIQAALQNRDSGLEFIGPSAFLELAESDQLPDNAILDTYAEHGQFIHELKWAYQAHWQAKLNPAPDQLAPKPTLDKLPLLHDKLTQLGFDDKSAAAFFESWSTINLFPHDIKSYQLPALEEKTLIEDVLERQQNEVLRHLKALSTYVETYGLDETKAVMKTFNIVNFARYTPEQLHNQLAVWEAGVVSPKNILLTAKGDHNGAMHNSPKNYTKQLGEEGFFYFEMGSKLELARAIAAIGQRERANGRDPLSDSRLENFIVNMHGSPTTLQFGIKGESLDIADYLAISPEDGELAGIRAQALHKRLGNNFRIILQACNAGMPEGIAEVLGTVYGVRIEADADKPARVTIQPNGDILFSSKDTEPHPSLVYGPQDRT